MTTKDKYAEARKDYISKGLITPGAPAETVQCDRCNAEFDRIKGRNYDTHCGRKDCRAVAASQRAQD